MSFTRSGFYESWSDSPTEQVGPTGNASDFYSGSASFESWPQHRLSTKCVSLAVTFCCHIRKVAVAIVWDVTSGSLVDRYRIFGEVAASIFKAGDWF
jgi:hypothetical protein